MLQPGRQYTAGTGYRYGFNGKENDNDVKGEGNQQDYGFRIYDPRLGKFLSVDPLTKSYPWYTPYQFAGNSPQGSIDIDGLEPDITWNANEQKEVKDNGLIQQNLDDVRCGNDASCKEQKQEIVSIYDKTKSEIAKAKANGYSTAANNLQFYLNGTGGKKLESYAFLSSFASFRIADNRLNKYLQKEAITLSSQVGQGETKTFRIIGYAASLTASNFFEKDLFYSSGTSFIKASATITIQKNSDNQPFIKILAAKTWIDTYDWHKGLGVYAVGLSDEDMRQLENFGAKDFEMRSYFHSTLSFSGEYEKHFHEHGISYKTPKWNVQTSQSEKTNTHPDPATTRGYRY